jgi:hypothetical protein
MAVSDTARIVGVVVFVNGVTVNVVLSVGEVMVGGVLSDVESEREIVIVAGKVIVGKVTVVSKGMVGEVLSESLDVESESEMVSKVEMSAIVVVESSGVGICSPTLDTSGSSTNIPDRSTLDTSGSSINIPESRSGVSGTRAESAK